MLLPPRAIARRARCRVAVRTQSVSFVAVPPALTTRHQCVSRAGSYIYLIVIIHVRIPNSKLCGYGVPPGQHGGAATGAASVAAGPRPRPRTGEARSDGAGIAHGPCFPRALRCTHAARAHREEQRQHYFLTVLKRKRARAGAFRGAAATARRSTSSSSHRRSCRSCRRRSRCACRNPWPAWLQGSCRELPRAAVASCTCEAGGRLQTTR